MFHEFKFIMTTFIALIPLVLLFSVGLLYYYFRLQKTQTIVFEIDTRVSQIPEDSHIFMACNTNDWNPCDGNYRFEPLGGGLFRLQLPKPKGLLEYKYTLGNWRSVEANRDGTPRINRVFQAGIEPLVHDKILNWENATTTSTMSENTRILYEHFEMPQLGRTRRIWIYLPTDYQTNTDKYYPVIYLQDGQNLFDERYAAFGEWDVDGTMIHLENQGFTGAIVVGIDNGSSLRIDEYSPYRNEHGGGEGDQYAQFLVETLKPHIDEKFRTLPQREHTAIGGSSMGGLIALYAGLKYEHIFGKLLIFSPSLWFSEQIYEFAMNKGIQFPTKYYFLGGDRESPYMRARIGRMAKTIGINAHPESHIEVAMREHGDHTEVFWRAEFGNACKWMFDFFPEHVIS